MMQEIDLSEAELNLAMDRSATHHQPVLDENGMETVELYAVGIADPQPAINMDLEQVELDQPANEEPPPPPQKIGYLRRLKNFGKGNIGTGCFAMGNAFRNGGLLMGPLFTIIIGLICLHCQHIVLQCAELMEEKRAQERVQNGLPPIADGQEDVRKLNFAETVEYCFKYGPAPFRPWATTMRHLVVAFTCIMQIGYCCIFLIFTETNLKQVADQYLTNAPFKAHLTLLLFVLVPLCMITRLRYLTPFAAFANALMVAGVSACFYYALKDPLPEDALTERPLVAEPGRIPHFFSTVIFAFEGIALVLPVQNGMHEPTDASQTYGLLNFGTGFIIVFYAVFGFVGFLRWGDEVQGSMTLNLPDGEPLANAVKIFIAFSVLLGFASQFFSVVKILWPLVQDFVLPSFTKKYPLVSEIIFRVLLVLLIFVISLFLPSLAVLISLMGAVCSTALALLFPAIIQLLVAYSTPNVRPSGWLVAKNIGILLLAVAGSVSGIYVCIRDS